MFEIFITLFASLLLVANLLRKVVLSSSTLSDNAASFTNVTGERLHARKIHGTAHSTAVGAIGDAAVSSLDEVPTAQFSVDDSRAHIGHAIISGFEASGSGTSTTPFYMEFDRGDLFLDPDESWFVNNFDETGAPPVDTNWNIWYED